MKLTPDIAAVLNTLGCYEWGLLDPRNPQGHSGFEKPHVSRERDFLLLPALPADTLLGDIQRNGILVPDEDSSLAQAGANYLCYGLGLVMRHTDGGMEFYRAP